MINNWERFLPGFIRKQFEKYENLKKITENIGWLFINRILGLVIGVFTGVWLARHLGPEKLGIWNYAIAFTGLFGALASLGLDSIVIRDIVNKPEDKDVILGSAFILKLISGIFTFVICIIVISLIKRNNTLILYLVGLNAIIYIFHSLNVIDFYFQSQVMSKYVVYAQNLSMIIGTISVIILLLLKSSLLVFAIVSTMNALIASLLLVAAFKYKKQSVFDWKWDSTITKRLLKDSFPLIFAGLAITIYMQIDKIMIGEMIGDKAVGIYSVATQISEMWYFIPMAIAGTFTPIILEIKKQDEKLYLSRLQKLYELMAFISITIAIITTFISPYLINFLFGKNFSESAAILSLHIWAGIPVCLGVASSIWLTAENLQKYSLYRTLIGCITNIVLNFILIPIYGPVGAALATIISYFISVYSLIIFNKSRSASFMMILAFLFRNLFRRNI